MQSTQGRAEAEPGAGELALSLPGIDQWSITVRQTERETWEEGKRLLFPFAFLSLDSLIPPVGCLDKRDDHRTGIAGFRPVTKQQKATRCRDAFSANGEAN